MVKRMFITGATGFVGAHLVRHFAAQGWSITASGRQKAPGALLKQVDTYLETNLPGDFPAVVDTDVVVHAASLASDMASEKILAATNVEGVRKVYEATRNCSVFVYISSASVYNHRSDPHRENEPIDLSRLSPYGRSKRRAETWLLEQDWSGRMLVVLRPRALYGTGDRVLLPRLMRLVMGDRIVMPGGMRVACSLTHIDNLCHSVMQSAQWGLGTARGVQVFNVADSEMYNLREVVERLLAEVCRRRLVPLDVPVRPLEVLANLLEALRMPTTFTRFGLQAVTQPCMLDVSLAQTKLELNTGHWCLWDALPELGNWVDRVGAEHVRAGNQDLPWM